MLSISLEIFIFYFILFFVIITLCIRIWRFVFTFSFGPGEFLVFCPLSFDEEAFGFTRQAENSIIKMVSGERNMLEEKIRFAFFMHTLRQTKEKHACQKPTEGLIKMDRNMTNCYI